eukprot:SAG11_NODE_1694_length_4437_cov_4.558552_5_plen_214_part_00
MYENCDVQLEVARRISAVANGTSSVPFEPLRVRNGTSREAKAQHSPKSKTTQKQEVCASAVTAAGQGAKPVGATARSAGEGSGAHTATAASVEVAPPPVPGTVIVRRAKSVVTALTALEPPLLPEIEEGGDTKPGEETALTAIVHLCNTEADWSGGFAKAALHGGGAHWRAAQACDEARAQLARAPGRCSCVRACGVRSRDGSVNTLMECKSH